MANDTKIIRCGCQHEYQDKQYGKHLRLMNISGKEKNEFICTVCGKRHTV